MIVTTKRFYVADVSGGVVGHFFSHPALTGNTA